MDLPKKPIRSLIKLSPLIVLNGNLLDQIRESNLDVFHPKANPCNCWVLICTRMILVADPSPPCFARAAHVDTHARDPDRSGTASGITLAVSLENRLVFPFRTFFDENSDVVQRYSIQYIPCVNLRSFSGQQFYNGLAKWELRIKVNRPRLEIGMSLAALHLPPPLERS